MKIIGIAGAKEGRPASIAARLSAPVRSGRPIRNTGILVGLIYALIAGGFAMAAWNYNRAAESRLGPSSAAVANWGTTDMRHLVPTLAAMHVRSIATQSESRSNNSATAGKRIECGPASAQLCPDDSLFRQLPELMTPSDHNDTVLQRPESSPYRELQLLPRPAIVPATPPDTGDILLERHPGDPG